MKVSLIARSCAACAMLAALTVNAGASTFTAVWFDGFDGPVGNDINAGLGAPRQGGSPIPTAYDTDVSFLDADQTTDYHQQIVGDPAGDRLLQLAGDTNINTPPRPDSQAFHAYASPDNNFKGLTGSGDVIGKKISLTVDTSTNFVFDPDNTLPDGIFTQSAVTIGSSEKLADSNAKLTGFSVIFIEQSFDTNIPENFIQVRDAGDGPTTPAGNLIPNPAGYGPANLELIADDPTDGNPWDGVGQTDIDVLVNGVLVFEYTKGGGGYADNYITLDGSNQKNVTSPLGTLAVHRFNNLTVFSAPVPEPTSAMLGGLAAFALVVRRQR